MPRTCWHSAIGKLVEGVHGDGWYIPACRRCGWTEPELRYRDGTHAMLIARELVGGNTCAPDGEQTALEIA